MSVFAYPPEKVSYKDACKNIYNSGYRSDKEYPEKLIAIIEQNKLYLYDCAPRPEITESTTDEDIKYLQKCLNSMKIRDINNNVLVVDGASGPLTIGTIKKLQQILNLSIDGICGPEVLSGVKTIMEKPLCSIKSTEYKTAIRYIQWRTGSAIDGIYGSETVGLVKEYQRSNKLVIDGIVGKGTWQSFLS
ncbi:peptidoglycan-binding protein [Clostridium estertheticum]|uniref:peptidoglycan-binding domain-containing protein n=1 Tax=Clostridium estertheticum TaxID=238834 RepID=UPI001C6E911E|nr:peptidoglycan-binding protein [Clostridium estertheticum]MBW9172491.1 peptidoglycan-binding protein [Clostridium estertheticum]WLC76550.1 peptidoglycan-binding protein [Clostridium estertheticum]